MSGRGRKNYLFTIFLSRLNSVKHFVIFHSYFHECNSSNVNLFEYDSAKIAYLNGTIILMASCPGWLPNYVLIWLWNLYTVVALKTMRMCWMKKLIWSVKHRKHCQILNFRKDLFSSKHAQRVLSYHLI